MNIIAMQGSLCTNCIRIHWIMYTEFTFIVYWVLTMTSNDLSMTFDCKFLKTLNLSHSIITSFKLHQYPLNYQKKVTSWLYFNNDPNWPLDDLWPNFMNTYMTFDPLTIGQMKREPWRLYDGWPIQHIGSGSFLILSYSTFDLSKKQIWTFLTFDPLTTGRMKRLPQTLFDGWPKPTHWHSQICWRRLFKIWLSTVTPRWPPIKNSWTPWKNLWPSISSPKFHQNLLNHVDEEAFWAYLNNDPKWPLDDIWPQIHEHPYLSPYLMIIVSKYHENPSRHIREEAFSNCELTDRYTNRYTDTSVCHKLIAPMMHELNTWWGEQETSTQLLQNQDAS